jgi:Holliday junction resolvase RusA-like endonuclease
MIEIDVAGIPAPQGSKTAIMRTGMDRPVLIESSSKVGRSKHKSWRKAVHDACSAWIEEQDGFQTLDEPIRVKILFTMPLGGDKYRTLHSTKPDIDKLARTVLDSLVTSKLIKEDSRVWRLDVTKLYAPSGVGCRVVIFPHGLSEALHREEKKSEAKALRQKERIA